MEPDATPTDVAEDHPTIVVVMGVCGCGKTLIGKALAQAMGCRFVEGDEYHPAENVIRMRRGNPLTDEDRRGWLDAIAGEITQSDRAKTPVVIACSALKRAYRDRLRMASSRILFIHLETDRATATARTSLRKDHFMPASLVDSQFADLEPPLEDERAVTLDAALDPEELVSLSLAMLVVTSPGP